MTSAHKRRPCFFIVGALALSAALAGCKPRAVDQVERDMVDIPAGSYVMGLDGQKDATIGHPAHTVTIKAFRMSKYDVTFAEYDAFAKSTGRALPDDGGWGRGANPVINIDWDDIHAFIDWLNGESGRTYRLPSESEWEYAARAGATTPYWWGQNVDPTKFNGPSDKGPDVWGGISPVGRFPANRFGLYDVTGNVFQVLADCRHPTYEGAPADGSAWLAQPCDVRVMRGGSWHNEKLGARLDVRDWFGMPLKSTAVGFRLAEDDAH